MEKLNSEGTWRHDPKRNRAEPADLEVDGDWLDDIFDDEYMDDDPISEEEAMDWARRFGGQL